MKNAFNFRNIKNYKARLLLPLLVFPFLSLLFWSLGGGQKNGATQKFNSGLNTRLPGANLEKEGSENKLDFYEQATKEDLKLDVNTKNELSFPAQIQADTLLSDQMHNTGSVYDPIGSNGGYINKNEEKVYRNLAELDKQLKHADNASSNSASHVTAEKNSSASTNYDRADFSRDRGINQIDKDPQLEQLNGMMEKILDIQHPDRLREKIRVQSQTANLEVYSLAKKGEQASVTEWKLDSAKAKTPDGNGFHSRAGKGELKQIGGIEAVIDMGSPIVNKGVVKLRTLSDAMVNGAFLPKGSLVSGTGEIKEERLEVTIRSIMIGKAVYQVNLAVFDLDGIEGVYIPGTISREVAKSSVDNATRMLQITSLDPSLKSKAADAGLSAAKALLSKKAKQIRVLIPRGYIVVLVNQNNLLH